MYQNNSFLAIVPARAGSKRLPKKNLVDFNGKPLVEWSIAAGLNSKYVDKVVVTSDDNEVLNIAKKNGVETIDRPKKLARDRSSIFDVIKHTVDRIEKYHFTILLQPTSPLRTSQHIDEAINLLINKNADSIISVCKTDHTPLWSNTLPENSNMSNFIKDDVQNKRSQDFETYYRLNGAIYICNTKKLLIEKNFFLKKNVFAYKMNRDVSVDIDSPIDLKIAKALST
jgi:CMP-N,N'-diacetyllegionaminic acid synthase